MKYFYTELKGALYQPKEIFAIGNCWIIPGRQNALTRTERSLFFVRENFNELILVLCYQFLFGNNSVMYNEYSQKIINLDFSKSEGTNIDNIEKQIRYLYGQQSTETGWDFSKLLLDFSEIEPFYTSLPVPVNFSKVFVKFSELYEKDSGFKEIISLLCDTGYFKPLYNNVLQQLAQLQTIVDAMVGEPRSKKCKECGLPRYVEKMDDFMKNRLIECGLTNPEYISLMIKVKTRLNRPARVKYIHNASYYNPVSNLVNDIRAGKLNNYKFDIEQILSKDSKEWSFVDWENVYWSYHALVCNLIYFKYFS